MHGSEEHPTSCPHDTSGQHAQKWSNIPDRHAEGARNRVQTSATKRIRFAFMGRMIVPTRLVRNARPRNWPTRDRRINHLPIEVPDFYRRAIDAETPPGSAHLGQKVDHHVHSIAFVAVLVVSTELVVVFARIRSRTMAPILLGIVHEAEYPVARDGVAVSSIVVAIELALVHVTTHVPHHAGHPVSNPDLSTNNGIAMMIGEPGLVVHWPRVFSLLDVQAVEGLAIDTDLGCAEREVTRIRIDGLGGIVMTAPPDREHQEGGGYERHGSYCPLHHFDMASIPSQCQPGYPTITDSTPNVTLEVTPSAAGGYDIEMVLPNQDCVPTCMIPFQVESGISGQTDLSVTKLLRVRICAGF